MLVPLIPGSANSAVFTFEVMATSSAFWPAVVPGEAVSPGLAAGPGLPAAPVSAGPAAVLEGLEVVPGGDGLDVDSAAVAGLSAPLVRAWSSPSRPTSQPANANDIIMAEAITLLFQISMKVFLFLETQERT